MPFIHINGKKLYYVRQPAAGNEQSDNIISILLIHGLGSSSSFYGPIIPGLVESGFHCLAFDTYGSGLSKYDGAEQSTKIIAEDVIALMSALSLSPKTTILVGHSMGAIIACELASTYPFAGVTLIGPVDPAPNLADVFTSRIREVQAHGMESMADKIPKAATGRKSTPTHHAFIRSLLLAQETEGYVSLCKVISDAQPPNYESITCPVLVLAGSDDLTAQIASVMQIFNRCGSVEKLKTLQIIEGVGHWHVIEAADAVLAHLLDFLNSIDPKGK